MKTYLTLWCLMFCLISISVLGQSKVHVDKRLRPLLDAFFMHCDEYGIDYHDKLFQLQSIDISDDLPFEKENVVLGMVTRNESGEIENILINWAAQLDPGILKVVAFHEFAHHFLDYKHTCDDCNEIMAVDNSDYFTIINDWDVQVKHLFTTSPIYLRNQAADLVSSEK